MNAICLPINIGSPFLSCSSSHTLELFSGILNASSSETCRHWVNPGFQNAFVYGRMQIGIHTNLVSQSLGQFRITYLCLVEDELSL